MISGIETWFLDIITKVYDAIGWPGVVLLMGIESAAIPLPSELVMPLAGWHLIEAKGDSAWMLLMAGFYGAVGTLLGSWVVYWISYKGGRPLLHELLEVQLLHFCWFLSLEPWFGLRRIQIG